MNLIFGTDDWNSFTKAQRLAKEKYNKELELFHISSDKLFIGYIKGNLTSINIDASAFTISLGQAERYHGNLSKEIATNPSHFKGQYITASVKKAEKPELELFSDKNGMRKWFATSYGLNFCSNIKFLSEVTDNLKTNQKFENFFLVHGFFPLGTTVFENIHELSHADISYFDGSWKNKSFPIGTEKETEVIQPKTESEAIELLYEHLMESLKAQFVVGQKCGVLLGGFDSALVASALVELGAEVETYSFAYKEESYNQPYVNELAEYLNINHYWVDITPDTLKQGFNYFTKYFNYPTNWPNYVISTLEACQMMADNNVDVVFSGDGCDTIFMGYPGTFKRAKVIEFFDKVPKSLTKQVIKLAKSKTLDREIGHPYRVAMGVLRGSQRTFEGRNSISFRIFDETSIENLKGKPLTRSEKELIDDTANKIGEEFKGMHPYRMAYSGKGKVSPNKNKMLGSADKTGLLVWSPYMDSKLKHFAANLPETMMRPNETTESKITGKYILQKMSIEKNLLPEEIVYQPKVAAVDAPIDYWNSTKLFYTLYDLWNLLPFKADNLYLRSLVSTTEAEKIFRNKIMTDKVISHGANLLATLGAFAKPGTENED